MCSCRVCVHVSKATICHRTESNHFWPSDKLSDAQHAFHFSPVWVCEQTKPVLLRMTRNVSNGLVNPHFQPHTLKRVRGHIVTLPSNFCKNTEDQS